MRHLITNIQIVTSQTIGTSTAFAIIATFAFLFGSRSSATSLLHVRKVRVEYNSNELCPELSTIQKSLFWEVLTFYFSYYQDGLEAGVDLQRGGSDKDVQL